MIISNADFEQLKEELTKLFFVARNNSDFYVMEEADYLLQKLQTIEAKNLKKKQSLK